MPTTINHITFDSHDPYEQARWWCAVFEVEMDSEDLPGDPAAVVNLPSGPSVLFERVPEAKAVKNRVHLDLTPGTTRDEEVGRLLGLGATRVADHRRPDGSGWVTMADPEGNELCVERSVAERATSSWTVDTADAAPRVLVIGLDPYRVPGPWDPQPVADAIDVGRARFAEHGIGAQFCLVGLDGSDDVEALVAQALADQSWECVVLGGGMRDQLELFEQVVNLVRRHAPGAAIAFNSSPSDTFEAANRWLVPPT